MYIIIIYYVHNKPLKAGHAQNSVGNHMTYECHPLSSSLCFYTVIYFTTDLGHWLQFISYLLLLLNVSMTEKKTFYIKNFFNFSGIFKASE